MGNLLEILAMERLSTAVEDTLREPGEYRNKNGEYDRIWAYLIKIGLDKEKRRLIDKLMSLQNYFSAEYGRVAYVQGVKDGIKLVEELYG